MSISEEMLKETIAVTRVIYEHMADDISKTLFKQRILATTTNGTKDSLINMLNCKPLTKNMMESRSFLLTG